MFLEAHFGDVEFHMPDVTDEEPEPGEDDHGASLLVRLDEAEAQISLVNLVGVAITFLIIFGFFVAMADD